MRRRIVSAVGLGVAAVALILGACDKTVKTDAARLNEPQRYVPETVGTYARLVEGRDLPVRGHCVVVGLGQNGSAQVPASLSRYLTQYLLREGRLGSYHSDTKNLTPTRFLRDRDTAVVQVRGEIPPGAPKGTRFDVIVSALPETGTRSLDGGTLMPTDMRLAYGSLRMSGQGSETLAYAGGSIFVNPFTDRDSPKAQAALRQGRIIGGGEVRKSRTVRLSLRRPDFGMARRIQQRINERFGGERPVAVGKDSSVIDIRIPAKYRREYRRFLELVLQVPMRSGDGQWQQTARRIAKAIEEPQADHEGLSMTWESMGRQAIPFIRPVYRSRNDRAAFHAARAGLRLDDRQSAEVLLQMAQNPRSSMRVRAIGELGRHSAVSRASLILEKLINDKDDLVREAAYEALAARGNRTVLRRERITEDFILDILPAAQRPAIYVSQTGFQRIVLFGTDIPVKTPIFYVADEELVTINAKKGQTQLTVQRKLPRSGRYSESLATKATVADLVRTLGRTTDNDAEGKTLGLYLSYSQVVGILADLCEKKHISAGLRLQTPADYKRLYERSAPLGRPDMPGS